MNQTGLLSPANDPQPQSPGWKQIAGIIDHTLLKPDATRKQVEKLCREAVAYGFNSVMVNPCQVARAVSLLRGSSIVTGTVIGFPLGAATTTTKLAEAAEALKLGARELDMVINIGALKSGERDLVEAEICALTTLARRSRALLKVILETALLTTEEKILVCQLCLRAKADFVKTSTGFGPAGATVEDVVLLRGVVGHEIGVKAAGGIRTATDLLAMVEAGASRIGTSAGVLIVQSMGAPIQ
jgi:deoxyribose-phosphate aldolase